jgi:tungsten cofactor oxidoreducase radical SAM maturase
MPIVRHDNHQGITLPQDFLQRRHLSAGREYWLDEREGDLILHPRLPDVKKIYIEATTGCNLQCRTCIRNVWSDPLSRMSPDTFQHIIENLADLPELEQVVFTCFGEPFTHPAILQMVAAVQKFGLEVVIGTNGMLLKPKIIGEIIRLGVNKLVISIDGGRSETHADIRGVSLSPVIENIITLNQMKHQMDSLSPSIEIEFVIMQSNAGELNELAVIASKLNAARVLVSHVLPYTEDMRSEILYGYEPVTPFKTSSWANKADAWIMWATMDLPRMHWGAVRRCRFVQNKAMVIGWDGAVSPCYALSHNYSYFAIEGVKKQVSRYILGNVNGQSLKDIWMSEDYVRFRSEVREFHFPSCPNCDLRETCDLRTRNEGCWGWNPSCADCLWAQDIIRCP